jgi:hypothetical protein
MRGLTEVEAVAPREARVFLFLLPSGRPRRRGDEGAATAAGAVFLPLPFGWLGPCFSGTLAPPGALVTRVAAEAEGATAAAATRASKVFLLRLPFRRPRFRDTGGAISGALASILLPSRTLSPLAAEPLREDMTGLGSEGRGSRRGEKWGSALGHERAQHLKRSGEGDDTRHFGNHLHIVCNRCGCRSGSWREPMGCIADVYQPAPHDDSGSYDGGDSKVKTTRRVTGALHRPQRGIKARSDTSSKGVAYRLVTTRQPLAGSDLEPACPETTGRAPRDLTSRPTTPRPNEESWDFDGNGQDFGEEKNLRKPHANP